MNRRRLKIIIDEGTEENALFILVVGLAIKTMRLLALAFKSLLTFFLLFCMAIDALILAVPYILIDHRIRPAYYKPSDPCSPPRGRISPEMAQTVSSSMAIMTGITLITATIAGPIFLILLPTFAICVIVILVRDQYIYTRVPLEACQ